MPERQPPALSEDTPIGPDVDLDHENIRLADGTRLTTEVANQIVEHVHRVAGRPSLTEPGRHSPQVSARVPAELHDAAKQEAEREGVSMSHLLREALEKYLGYEVRDLKGGRTYKTSGRKPRRPSGHGSSGRAAG